MRSSPAFEAISHEHFVSCHTPPSPLFIDADAIPPAAMTSPTSSSPWRRHLDHPLAKPLKSQEPFPLSVLLDEPATSHAVKIGTKLPIVGPSATPPTERRRYRWWWRCWWRWWWGTVVFVSIVSYLKIFNSVVSSFYKFPPKF